jgi:hypothetical protein
MINITSLEVVRTFEQSTEATKFLARLADEGTDELGESARVEALGIMRGDSAKIVAVIACVNASEETSGAFLPQEKGTVLLFTENNGVFPYPLLPAFWMPSIKLSPQSTEGNFLSLPFASGMIPIGGTNVLECGVGAPLPLPPEKTTYTALSPA